MARSVRAYLVTTGALQASGASDGSGNFSLTVPTTAAHFVVQQDIIIDPNVSLLMHMEGSDYGTSFPDDTGKTISVAGGACTRTSNQKLGTACAYFDGTGDYIYPASASGFAMGTGDFCVECFVKPSANKSAHMIVAIGAISSVTGFTLHLNYDFYPKFRSGGADLITGSVPLVLNTWAHLALERVSGVFSLYIDGVNRGTYSGAITLSDNNLYIGTEAAFADASATNHLQGYLDELRITKGAYRYNGAFTPTTSPFTVVTNFGDNALAFDNVVPV